MMRSDKATGATAVVPGSHKLVPEINAFRKMRTDSDGKYIGPAASEAADIECFTANGLTPCVSCIRAGDLVIFGECLSVRSVRRCAPIQLFICIAVILRTVGLCFIHHRHSNVSRRLFCRRSYRHECQPRSQRASPCHLHTGYDADATEDTGGATRAATRI